MKLLKYILLSGSLLASAPALANDTTNPDEIIVTARKVEERINEVPASIIYTSGLDLENRSATTLSDVFGFNARPSGANPGTTLFAMRGQGQNDISLPVEPSVGVYVDGVYSAQAFGLNSNLLDIKNVQVLPGPQGTIFGRNTTGGAIVIETNDPNPGSTDAELGFTYGRFNEVRTTGILNLPLNNKITVRAAGSYNVRDGFVTNKFDGRRYNNIDNVEGRVKVLFQPSDDYEMLLTGTHFKDSGNTARHMLIGFGAFSGLATPNADDEVNLPLPSTANTQVNSISLTNNIGDNLKIITAWRGVQQNTLNTDLDGSVAIVNTQSYDIDTDQYSLEVNYNNDAFDGRLRYSLGAFVFAFDGTQSLTNVLFSDVASTKFDGTVRNRSYSAFGRATYDLTDRLSVDAGLRFTRDIKNLENRNKSIKTIPTYIENSCRIPGLLLSNNCAYNTSVSYNDLSWTAGLNYKVDTNNFIYGKVSTGYKAGGNQFFATAAIPNLDAFKPEKITEFEVGAKGQLFDDRLGYSIAAYYNEVKDGQIMSVYPVGLTFNVATSNIARMRNYGVEAQLSAKVTDNFTLRAVGMIERPKFVEFNDPITGADRTNSQFYLTTQNQFTVDGEYKIGRYTLNANYTWIDRTPAYAGSYANFIRNYGPVVGEEAFRFSNIPAHGLLNLRATVNFENMDVTVWGRNVLDNRFPVAVSAQEPAFIAGTFNDPATYGVTVKVKF